MQASGQARKNHHAYTEAQHEKVLNDLNKNLKRFVFLYYIKTKPMFRESTR